MKYFLFPVQVPDLEQTPIYYFVNLLIRVDTNRAEIYLASYSNAFYFFSHFSTKPNFLQGEGKEGREAVGVKFPVFYQQDEYDLLPSETGKKQPRTAHNYKQSSKGYSWERIIKLWKALGCRK